MSIVIPVKNESATVGVLVESLLQQTAQPFEILVVDAGSKDGTPEIVRSFIAKGHPVELFTKEGAYPGVGRNLGAAHARSPWLVFIDAGVHVSPDWLEKMYHALDARPEPDVVYSNWLPLQDSFFRKAFFVAYGFRTRVFLGKRVATHGAIVLVRKEVWSRVGGYPEYRASEDREFVSRIGKAGFREHWCPEAVAIWEPSASFFAAFRRSFSYGYHGLLAGKARDWHMGVVRVHLIVIGVSLVARFVTPFWWTFLPAGLLSRVMKRAVAKGRDSAFHDWEWLPGLLYAAVLLLASDVAALASGVYFLLEHKIRRRPNPYRALAST